MLVYTIQCKNGKILVNNHGIQNTADLLLYIAKRYEVDIKYLFTTDEGEGYYDVIKNDIKRQIIIKFKDYGFYSKNKMKRLIAKDAKRITKFMDKFYECYNNSDFEYDLIKWK